MTAVEKITESILLDAKAEAEKIVADAKADAKAVINGGKAEAKRYEAELMAVIDKKADNTAESQKSAAALFVRNAVLLKKREEIDKTLEELLKYFLNLETEEYFELLLKLAKKRASNGDGIMFLNTADLGRMPKAFSDNIKKLKISVSEKPLDSISGGFVLKYGDVEENADFKALIAENYELFTDIIGKELFL